MIHGSPGLVQAVRYYNYIESELKSKSDEELKTLVEKLNPKVKRDNKIVFGGLVAGLTSLLVAGACQEFKALKEVVDAFGYVGLSSFGLSTIYGLIRFSGKGLKYSYQRDAANNILEERRNQESLSSAQQ